MTAGVSIAWLKMIQSVTAILEVIIAWNVMITITVNVLHVTMINILSKMVNVFLILVLIMIKNNTQKLIIAKFVLIMT